MMGAISQEIYSILSASDSEPEPDYEEDAEEPERVDEDDDYVVPATEDNDVPAADIFLESIY